ncbi:MAG: DNA polymerase III subunit beta [Acidimicrobiia bacterium]
MRIRGERDDLAEVFARASRAVGLRSALPILQGLWCRATGNVLQVVGTDLEMVVRSSTEVEVLEEGETVVAARLASEAIRKLPPGAVTVGTEDGEVEIVGGGPRFRLREMVTDDFPRLTEPDFSGGVEVGGGRLEAAVAQVSVAASSDAARPILTGVLFEKGQEGLRLVATDSYRLAVCDLLGVETGKDALVPARALRELSRTVGSAKTEVAIGEREAAFRSEKGTLSTRLIEGSFPNYRQLLPEHYPNLLVVEREDLLEALGRATLVAEDHIPVRMKMGPDGTELTVSRQEVGGETEFLKGEYRGEDVTIAFNPRYLTDGVSVVDSERVQIELVDGLKPAVIRGVEDPDFLYLLMPVRI